MPAWTATGAGRASRPARDAAWPRARDTASAGRPLRVPPRVDGDWGGCLDRRGGSGSVSFPKGFSRLPRVRGGLSASARVSRTAASAARRPGRPCAAQGC